MAILGGCPGLHNAHCTPDVIRRRTLYSVRRARNRWQVMNQYFLIHTENTQQRLITQAVDIIRGGGLAVYPTDSAYALGCHIGDKAAIDRIRLIRQLDKHHNFTLMCRDLSELAVYDKVTNTELRPLPSYTPAPCPFLLDAPHATT